MKANTFKSVLVLFLILAGSSVFAQDNNATAAKEWRSYVEPLLPMGERLAGQIADTDDVQLRQELYRATFSALAGGYLAMVYADPEHPDFVPYLNEAFNILGPNPDNVYYMTPIQDDGVYKISGYRGTVHIVDFQIGAGTFVTRGTAGNLGTTLANHDADSLHIKKDGAFEVVLSAERPAGYTGDWWKLDGKASYVMVRQIAYDWLHEVDARIAIERLDRPAIKPRPSASEIEANLRQMATWAESYVAASNRIVKSFGQRGYINTVGFIPFGDDGGITTQKYIEGLFDLAPDEALLLETEVPKQCHYWSFQLTDERWTSIDWMSRQTSLNGYSARVDKDGKFRAVISAQDPGVPNWLDTAGYARGVIQGRWERCSSWPLPVVTKIKLADIRKYVSADTPQLSSEARDAAIRLRRKGAQLRRRW